MLCWCTWDGVGAWCIYEQAGGWVWERLWKEEEENSGLLASRGNTVQRWGERNRHLYSIQLRRRGCTIHPANYFLESCLEWVNFLHQANIGIGPWRIVEHICVCFQTCPNILSTISGTEAELSQSWLWWKADNERSLEDYLAQVGASPGMEPETGVGGGSVKQHELWGLIIGPTTFNESRDSQHGGGSIKCWDIDKSSLSPSPIRPQVKIQVQVYGEEIHLEANPIFLIGSMIQCLLIQYPAGLSHATALQVLEAAYRISPKSSLLGGQPNPVPDWAFGHSALQQ